MATASVEETLKVSAVAVGPSSQAFDEAQAEGPEQRAVAPLFTVQHPGFMTWQDRRGHVMLALVDLICRNPHQRGPASRTAVPAAMAPGQLQA